MFISFVEIRASVIANEYDYDVQNFSCTELFSIKYLNTFGKIKMITLNDMHHSRFSKL
jgi:hypothetical protein